jgi:dihydroorotase (multifunctional complex type)
MTDLVIKGGTVVSAHKQERADLAIEDGKIRHVGDVESHAGRRVIDASGLLVLPGMVDTHVHLMDPGPTEREDFPTGTNAAAARGVTTIVEHTHAHPVRSVADLRDKVGYLDGRANVDYGLAAHVWPETVAHIAELAAYGISFFKIFTCDTHGVPGLDPSQVSAALTEIAAVGGRALVHNEDQSLTASAEQRLRDENRIDPGLLIEWRNREAEMVAVAATAASTLESGARVTFAHVSNPLVLDIVDSFRALGATIAAEACPQYFAIDEDEVEAEGALRKFTPPARIRDEQERWGMWQALRDSRFSFVSTDHAPSTRGQKTQADFWDAPFGLPGLDTTLPFLLDAASRGEMDITDVVRLYATEPAAWYRLPKGRLESEADADIVLVDPEASWTVDDSDIISKAGWSPYSGRIFRGRPVATYLGGREIASDGKPNDLRSGRFIRPGADQSQVGTA